MTTNPVDTIVIGANPNPAGDTVGATSDGIWLGLANDDSDTLDYGVYVNAVDTSGTAGEIGFDAAGSNGVWYQPGTAYQYLAAGQTAIDTFGYTVTNGQGLSVNETDSVVITGTWLPPAAAGGSAATDSGTAIGIDLLASASDPQPGVTLSVTGVDTTGTAGDVVLNGDGTVTYTPGTVFDTLAAGATATDSFGYTVSDGVGGTASAVETVTITGSNAVSLETAAAVGLVAKSDAATMSAATHGIWIGSTNNDTDPQAYPLSIIAVGTANTRGIVQLGGAGSTGVYYEPGTAFQYLGAGQSTTDSFTYTVSDGHGHTAIGTDTVTITGAWLPPVAADGSAATDAGTAIGIDLLANATDPQPGVTLGVSDVDTAGTAGGVTLNPDGTATYTPGTAFDTLAAGATATDSFGYTVSDGQGGTDSAVETVTITGTYVLPGSAGNGGLVANPDAATMSASTHGIWIGSTDNDTDPRNYPLGIVSVGTANTRGIVQLGGTGSTGVFYEPGTAFQSLVAGQSTTDSFTYTVSDGHGHTSTATDTVTIIGAGALPPPVAKTEDATVAANKSVTLDPLAGDSDPRSGVTLGITALNLAGTKGKAVLNADGTITYTPGAAYAGLATGSSGTDSFTYTLSDGQGGTATGTVDLTVTGTGTAPAAARAFYVATNGNNAWAGDLAAPNSAGTDGPLATLKAAQLKMEASPTVKTTYVEGGNYYLTSTMYLSAADDGQSWLAMPGQTPVIHGGEQVTGWVKGANGIWTAPAPAGSINSAGAGNTDLFVNGVREEAARYPNASPTSPMQGGWVAAAASSPGENTRNSFRFTAGSIPAFTSSAGLYVSIYEQNGWQSDSLPISSINYGTDTITLAGNAGGSLGLGSRFFIYDAASQLNTPGEWYANTANNTISLDAPAGFNGTGVTTGSLNSIFLVNQATNVTIAGLTLEGTTPKGVAITGDGATGLTVAGNTINGVGEGLQLQYGSTIDLQGNLIENTDNYGVQIEAGTNYVTIQGNTIKNIGQLLNGSGIWFDGSSHDTITNNLVQNTANHGIGGGSTQGTSDGASGNTISYNQVIDANQTSSDGGGIYLTGTQLYNTGDVVSDNEISGTSAVKTTASPTLSFLPASGLVGFGVYLDDYASGVTVKGNLLNGNVGGIDIHAGSNNTVTDNIVANSATNALQFQLADPLNLTSAASGNLFKGNLVSDSSAPQYLVDNLGNPANAAFVGNFYNTAGLSGTAFVSDTNGAWRSTDLAGWRAQGYDTGGISGNPGFTPGTLTLGAGSAALAAGITNAPTSQIGLAGFVPTNSYDL